MSSLHLRNGEPASLKKWNEVQMRLAQHWKMRDCEHWNEEEAVKHWAEMFAGLARRVCTDMGIDVETFEEEWQEFENRFVEHLETLKWALGARMKKEEVGVVDAYGKTQVILQETKNGVKKCVCLTVIFPHVDENGLSYELEKAHPEVVLFTSEDNCEETCFSG